jgi:hypothetical protein
MPAVIIAIIDMLHLFDDVLVITVKPYLLVLKLLFALLWQCCFLLAVLCWISYDFDVICALRVRGRDVRKKK